MTGTRGWMPAFLSHHGPGRPGAHTRMNDSPADRDSYAAMLQAVQAFHDKHDFRGTGGEDLVYRVALMAEELGEISACVTKGRSREALAEECADLLILVMGTAISADFDLRAAFWAKMERLMARESRMVGGRIRVSEFRGVEDAGESGEE